MAVHPGEFLIEQILLPSGVPIRKAAEQLSISVTTLSDVISGKSVMTVPLAHALAREFGYSRQWWLDLQRAWDQEQSLAA